MHRLLLFVSMIALFASAAAAQGTRRGRRAPPSDGPPPPTLADLETIVPKLDSANPDEVREAIDLLSVIDRPEVVPPLAALLRSGRPDAITDRAITALGGLGHSSAIDVLTEFTRHRRPGARRGAYRALASIHHESVAAIIERGLSDSDRAVRATAATSLGDIGAKGSLDALFRAFERGVVEAAIAIGKLGDEQSVNKFSEHLGRQHLSIVLSGYREFLGRADMAEGVKTQVVAKLGEVSGPMVRRFLEDYLATFAQNDRGRLKEHVEQTLRRIPRTASEATAPQGVAPPTQGATP